MITDWFLCLLPNWRINKVFGDRDCVYISILACAWNLFLTNWRRWKGVTEICHNIDWENFQPDHEKEVDFSWKDIFSDLLKLGDGVVTWWLGVHNLPFILSLLLMSIRFISVLESVTRLRTQHGVMCMKQNVFIVALSWKTSLFCALSWDVYLIYYFRTSC